MCSDYRLKNDKKNETWGQVPFLGEGILLWGSKIYNVWGVFTVNYSIMTPSKSVHKLHKI